MKKDAPKFSFYLIIILFILVFFIGNTAHDRITNLISCEGGLSEIKKDLTTIVHKDGTTEFYTDYCVNNVLYESYCHNQNEMRTKRLFCSGGCLEGICFSSEKERISILGLQGYSGGGGPSGDSSLGGGQAPSPPASGAPGVSGDSDKVFFRGECGPEGCLEYELIEGEQEGLIVVPKKEPETYTEITEPTTPIGSLESISRAISLPETGIIELANDFYNLLDLQIENPDLEGFILSSIESFIQQVAPTTKSAIESKKTEGATTIFFIPPPDEETTPAELGVAPHKVRFSIPQ